MYAKINRNFCKNAIFCDVYVISYKIGLFLTNFLISVKKKVLLINVSLQEQNFIVWSKKDKRIYFS